MKNLMQEYVNRITWRPSPKFKVSNDKVEVKAAQFSYGRQKNPSFCLLTLHYFLSCQDLSPKMFQSLHYIEQKLSIITYAYNITHAHHITFKRSRFRTEINEVEVFSGNLPIMRLEPMECLRSIRI